MRPITNNPLIAIGLIVLGLVILSVALFYYIPLLNSFPTEVN